MKTREKILLTAQNLFNREGVDLITPRRIALEVGLSHGNLRYHFPKKEDILLALYMQLVNEFDDAVSALGKEPSLQLAFQMMEAIYSKLYAYRYLMNDFVSIMRQVDAIRTHYKALFVARRGQFLQLLEALQQQGMLREDISQKQFERFVWQLNIFSDFWIGAAEIHFEAKGKSIVAFFVDIAFAMIYPYLTEKGIEVYHECKESIR